MKGFLELFGTVGFFLLVSYRPLAHALSSGLAIYPARVEHTSFVAVRKNKRTFPPYGAVAETLAFHALVRRPREPNSRLGFLFSYAPRGTRRAP